MTEHYSENHPRLIEKLDAFVPGALRDRIDSALAVGDEDETTSFVCLIHNDVWRNNIMYT